MARLLLLFVAGMIFTAHAEKPAAHIEAELVAKTVLYPPDGTVIADFSLSAPYSYLAGGMRYQDGKLTVPTNGRYYIYAQIYYMNKGRVFVNVNRKAVTMMQPPITANDHGTLNTGGVFNLKAGDEITLTSATYPEIRGAKIYMASYHSYFGAILM